MTIWFDMDGTIANLYGVENWLTYLQNADTKPYEIAKPLVNMNTFAKTVHKAQKNGVKVGVISWTAKNASAEYNARVARAKRNWLKKHLKSVKFDAIQIVEYGTPKYSLAEKNDVLFDDETKNRTDWTENCGKAFDVNDIIPEMVGLI